MIGLLLGLSKGYLFTPWRSPYLLWRVETYSGIEASSITPAIFWKFVWDNKRSLLRYVRWGAEQRAKFLAFAIVFALAANASAEIVGSFSADVPVRQSFRMTAAPNTGHNFSGTFRCKPIAI